MRASADRKGIVTSAEETKSVLSGKWWRIRYKRHELKYGSGWYHEPRLWFRVWKFIKRLA